MTYFTHIPKTTYAQRHQSFVTFRAEARRSLRNCLVLQDALLTASMAKLQRNYIDVDGLTQNTRAIIKTSRLIRELSPITRQPDPPEYEPVGVAETQTENRTYGGIKAARLVKVLRFLRLLKQNKGEGALAKRVRGLSGKLVTGLDIYRRVKKAIARLTYAVNNPATAITPRRRAKSPAPKVSRTWETSPQKIYGWAATYRARGYDPRQTSVYWIEAQAATLKRAIYREHHGIETKRAPRRPRTTETDTRTFTPPEGAQVTGQIWPPIDLVRLIEARQCVSSPVHGGSGRVALEGGALQSKALVGMQDDESAQAETSQTNNSVHPTHTKSRPDACAPSGIVRTEKERPYEIAPPET